MFTANLEHRHDYPHTIAESSVELPVNFSDIPIKYGICNNQKFTEGVW